MLFIIVKNAGVISWRHYFLEDPKAGPVHPTYSCHETYTGKELGIKPSYEDFIEAEAHCKKLNEVNPVGDYAICQLMQA